MALRKTPPRSARGGAGGRGRSRTRSVQPTRLWQRLFGDGSDDQAEPSDPGPVAVFLSETAVLLADCGVAPTPNIVLRVHDVAVTLTIALAVETPLLESLAAGGEPAPAAVEVAAKARERWRKAMKDLEDSCTRAGTPIDQGLPDQMRPILRKAEGVLADALQRPMPETPPTEESAGAEDPGA